MPDFIALSALITKFYCIVWVKRIYKRAGYEVIKMKGINMTKSVAFLPLGVLINILTLFAQWDVMYMQFATVVRKAGHTY